MTTAATIDQALEQELDLDENDTEDTTIPGVVYQDCGICHWSKVYDLHSVGVMRFNVTPEMLGEDGYLKEYRDNRNKKKILIRFDKDFVSAKLVELLNQTGILDSIQADDILQSALQQWESEVSKLKNSKLNDAYDVLRKLNPQAYQAIIAQMGDELSLEQTDDDTLLSLNQPLTGISQQQGKNKKHK
jgi:hypothetical protein